MQLCEYWQLTVLSKWSDSISSCFRVFWLKESGIIDREYKYWVLQKPKCSGNAGGFTSVRLQDIFPPLLMFCFGIVLAAVILILEVLYKRLHSVECRHHRYTNSPVHNHKATDRPQFLSKPDCIWFTHKGPHLNSNWQYLPEGKANLQKNSVNGNYICLNTCLSPNIMYTNRSHFTINFIYSPEERVQYSDWLRSRRTRDWIPMLAKFSATVLTGPGV